jgi:hypothetical protein
MIFQSSAGPDPISDQDRLKLRSVRIPNAISVERRNSNVPSSYHIDMTAPCLQGPQRRRDIRAFIVFAFEAVFVVHHGYIIIFGVRPPAILLHNVPFVPRLKVGLVDIYIIVSILTLVFMN